jgi:hypothetical protein
MPSVLGGDGDIAATKSVCKETLIKL